MVTRDPVFGARRKQLRSRVGLALMGVAALMLAACGAPPPDPGATRTEAQSKELRDRIMETQGRT